MNQTKEATMKEYQKTIYCCYLGYVVLAIVNNLAPLLFLTFQKQFDISVSKITWLITINFAVQLLTDLVASKYVDKIGYRISIVGANVFAAAGFISMAVLPKIMPDAYVGLLIAVVLYAMGGGLIEVLISPIAEACPTEHKEKEMSMLHSFFCWGHVAVVVLSSIFFVTVGIENWAILSCMWALVPIICGILFSRVPIASLVEEGEGYGIRKLFSMKIFWILALLMICAGAAEQGMSQWASVFAQEGLGVSKFVGDLAGPCMFALCMGIARLVFAKYGDRERLPKMMIGSGVLCVISYLIACFMPNAFLALIGCGLCGFSVGCFWPGTFSMGAWKCPLGGTTMFALMALAGDAGCGLGPTLVGLATDAMGGNLRMALLFAIIFPVGMMAGLTWLGSKKESVI